MIKTERTNYQKNLYTPDTKGRILIGFFSRTLSAEMVVGNYGT
jgi:hypothetical protein